MDEKKPAWRRAGPDRGLSGERLSDQQGHAARAKGRPAPPGEQRARSGGRRGHSRIGEGARQHPSWLGKAPLEVNPAKEALTFAAAPTHARLAAPADLAILYEHPFGFDPLFEAL